jgi:hypothetical protein
MSIPMPPARADAKSAGVDKLALLPAAFRHADIMFVVRRTMNENLVVYALNRDRRDTSRLDAADPVHVYWVERDPTGGRAWVRNPLSRLETRLAYGVSVDRDSMSVSAAGTRVEFSLRAVPNRTLYGRLKPDHAKAFTYVRHHWCEVHSVDVKTGPVSLTSWNPVKWVAINGYDDARALQRERIDKT